MRLIDADALKDYYQHKGEYSLISYELIEDVNAQLTVDAVLLEDYMSMVRTVNKLTQALADSVKHGHWIPHPDPRVREWDVCSSCGIGCKRREYGDVWGTQYNYPFCPNCGAKMDG